MKTLRIALAQMNSTVGDLRGNSQKILSLISKAKKQQADVVAFPELAITGYPPEDLLLKPQFIADNKEALKKIVDKTTGIAAVIGFVDSVNNNLYNAAAIIADGRMKDSYHKILLPNYGVFDEVRYFRPGNRFPVYRMNGVKVGLNICEDIWHRQGPALTQARAGAELIININASPYEMGKPAAREKILEERSRENRVFIAYLNAVGGQDELVFDGCSMVYDYEGRLIARAAQFDEAMMMLDIDVSRVHQYRKDLLPVDTEETESVRCVKKISVSIPDHTKRKALPMPRIESFGEREEEVYGALVLGTADYVRKNGFQGVVIGLSGGIDSSLVAAIAADAIGRENVTGIFMPSPYTSKESREDAEQLALNLGIRIVELPIRGIMGSYMRVLEPQFAGKVMDTTEENLQARIRGNLLMALSNKFGWLVLTTGNKSEMSVGYATLYGDMAGGFAVIKDVPKTLVYDICRWRNAVHKKEIIPERVLIKEPTAELKPNQKDTDSLPPYDQLDPVLKAYIEYELSFDDILGLGATEEQTKRIIGMVDRSEYKRRQSPPGIKITGRAFGRDWRFPITNRYRSY
ncbi:MAG: NAD+ synthase [Nitrospirae bacterium]|nr:NAD+ synthase [Nitrospirota bacterium]